MKYLFVFDYERIIPAFMQTLLIESKSHFDKIFYVTPPMPQLYYDFLIENNIILLTWWKLGRLYQFIAGFFSFFRPNFWKELFKGPINFVVIKKIFTYYFCSSGFIYLSKNKIKHALKEGKEVYLLGTWMSVDAFTVARLKNIFPQAKGFTLAHSGEVIKERNTSMRQSFHEYIFENLDKVYFISKTVLASYLNDMDDIQIRERFKDKIANIYLGSNKISSNLNPNKDANKFTILTCSRIDANKRLDRIISSLSEWHSIPIKWIHIGTGFLEKEIKEKSQQITEHNPLVEIDMLGRIPNTQVIKFYSENHVDLFVNVSKSEGLPISIMEAMSYGIPCIATDVGGTSEIVNSSNGYLLPNNFTDDEFRNLIKQYIALPENKKMEMRNNAFNQWHDNFNAEKNAKELFLSWFE